VRTGDLRKPGGRKVIDHDKWKERVLNCVGRQRHRGPGKKTFLTRDEQGRFLVLKGKRGLHGNLITRERGSEGQERKYSRDRKNVCVNLNRFCPKELRNWLHVFALIEGELNARKSQRTKHAR